MKKVHLAVQVSQGVVSGVEVHDTSGPALQKVKEWGEEDEGKVSASYMERVVIKSGEDISTLGLPRLYERRLKRDKIFTVSQLTELSDSQLYFMRTVGTKCVQAVQKALAERGLSLAPRYSVRGTVSEKPSATCRCEEDQEMELIADNPRGSYFECPACGRILYRSKGSPVVSWFRADITGTPTGLEIERRFCADCNSRELHVRASGGDWRCLACVLKSLEADSQKSPEGA